MGKDKTSYTDCHYFEEHADDFDGCPTASLADCERCPYWTWKMVKWIPVDQELPDYRKNVVVLTKMNVPHIAKLVQMGEMKVWVSSSSTQYGDKIITHWCDCLPALPI